MGDTEARSDFPDRAQRFAFCSSVYEQSRSMKQPVLVRHTWFIGRGMMAPRDEQFLGRDFLVVPAVLVRSQVLHNNFGRTFLPASEFTDEWANMWNGIPVLVGPHPDGSGRRAELWNERGVGWIFNARVETENPTTRRLVAEVWMDLERANAVPEFDTIVERVRANQTVELSTGFPTTVENMAGQFDGEPFDVVLHPTGADHLVVSAEFTGACAVADGCGLGANSDARILHMSNPTTTTTGGMTDDTTNTPPVGVEVTIPDDTPQPRGVRAVVSRIAEFFGATPEPSRCTWNDNMARVFQREMTTWNLTNPSDQERMMALRDALQSKHGGADTEVIVTDVYSDTHDVVFWLSTPLGPQPPGGEFFMTQYVEAENGFTFEEPRRVRRMIRYEPAADAAGNTEPPAAIDAGENVTPHSEGDGTMADQHNTDVAAQLATLTEVVGKLADRIEQFEKQAKVDPNPSIAGLKTSIAEMAARLDSMEEPTRLAIAERERERQALVTRLAGNYRVPFNESELESKPIEELRKLDEMVNVGNFAGKPGGARSGFTPDEPKFAEPVPYWKKKGDE